MNVRRKERKKEGWILVIFLNTWLRFRRDALNEIHHNRELHRFFTLFLQGHPLLAIIGFGGLSKLLRWLPNATLNDVSQ